MKNEQKIKDEEQIKGRAKSRNEIYLSIHEKNTIIEINPTDKKNEPKKDTKLCPMLL